MRARSFLRENDNRTLTRKLQDLIDHPSTLETVREIAKEKLKKLLPPPVKTAAIHAEELKTATVNLDEQDLDRVFSFYKGNTTCRQLYHRLCSLKPSPSDIVFLRQGQIHIFVPPPFFGLTKNQYIKLLCDSLPGVRQISSKFIEEKGGYHFTITL